MPGRCRWFFEGSIAVFERGRPDSGQRTMRPSRKEKKKLRNFNGSSGTQSMPCKKLASIVKLLNCIEKIAKGLRKSSADLFGLV